MKKEYPRRGDIYWVKLDPADGKEICKTRPCVVISSDIANQSELIIVAPITSNVERIFPRIEIGVNVADKAGKVIPRQMRCIDRTKRLGKKIGALSPLEMNLIDDAIRLILSV